MPSEARQKKIMEKLNRAQKCSILGPQNLGSGGARAPGPPLDPHLITDDTDLHLIFILDSAPEVNQLIAFDVFLEKGYVTHCFDSSSTGQPP